MDARIRRKLDMAERVLVFNRTHAPTTPGMARVFERLEERVIISAALIQQEERDRNRSIAGNGYRARLRRRFGQGLLAFISRVGLAGAKADPTLEPGFVRVPPKLTELMFVPIAGRLVGAARRHLDVLLDYGLDHQVVAEAESFLARYVEATEEAETARQARMEATQMLREVAREIVELVGRIDRFNRHRFADNPEILGVWNSARRVGGHSRHHEEPPVQGTSPELALVGTEPASAAGERLKAA